MSCMQHVNVLFGMCTALFMDKRCGTLLKQILLWVWHVVMALGCYSAYFSLESSSMTPWSSRLPSLLATSLVVGGVPFVSAIHEMCCRSAFTMYDCLLGLVLEPVNLMWGGMESQLQQTHLTGLNCLIFMLIYYVSIMTGYLSLSPPAVFYSAHAQKAL